MPRYEFSEGSSNKFWEINLSGKAYTTTYGKIGSNGQTTIKTYGSDAEAKKEYDKIVAEKTKKGYVLVGGKGVAKAAAPADDDDDDAPAPKKSAKKSAKASPAPKTAKAPKPGSPRHFEFSEGSSNKFWEISVDGTTVRTRYGKIGASGQLTIKEFDDKAGAFKEVERLIHEKTKKGYVESGGGGGGGGEDGGGDAMPAKGDARNPALEKAILANPYDEDAWAVLADWLQEQGDPRGELMALQMAGKDKAAKTMIEKQAAYFLGPLAEHQRCYDGDLGNNARSNSAKWVAENKQAFLWKHGFIHRVRLAHDSYANEEFQGSLADVLKLLVAHPSGRFVVEWSFNSNGDPNENPLDDLWAILAKHPQPATRKILIGDNVDQISWYHVGHVGKIWKSVPNLVDLKIEAGEFELGTIELPNLEKAIFETGGLSKSAGKAIANAKIPKIKHLEVYYGTDEYGGNCSIKDVKPLLARTDLKHLTYLGLKNSEFANDIAKALDGAKILKQLKTLDLSLGTLNDEGAASLAAIKDQLKHLEVLDLTRNFLTKTGIAAVKGLAKNVITKSQEQADDSGDGEVYYYVAVAE